MKNFVQFVKKASPAEDHVQAKSFINYCAIGAAQIQNRSKFQLVLGGAIPYLKNEAAQKHLKERLKGVQDKKYALSATHESIEHAFNQAVSDIEQ